MSIFVFTTPDKSWYGQTGTVEVIIEFTRDRLSDFDECVADIYRPLDFEGQVFIGLENACADCFNYFFAISYQAMCDFPSTFPAKAIPPASVRRIVATWEGLLEFLKEDERFSQEQVTRAAMSGSGSGRRRRLRKFDAQNEFSALKFGIGYANGVEFDPAKPMGNVAVKVLEYVLSAACLGMFSKVRHVIPKCQGWLLGAIEQRESYGASTEFHLSRLHSALAIFRWLQDGTIDQDSWRLALQQEEIVARRDGFYLQSDRKSVRLDEVVPAALLAGEPSVVICAYRGVSDSENIVEGVATLPRDFGYTIALPGSALWLDRDALFAMGKDVLRDSLNDWLARGEYMVAAKWVCLIYSTIGGRFNAAEALGQAVSDLQSS